MPSRLQAYANSKDVKIVGDMPIYVGAQSADVWAHQELFELDDSGAAVNVAGVPPDAFSETGQLWGNPLYDWPVGMLTPLLSLNFSCLLPQDAWLIWQLLCFVCIAWGGPQGAARKEGAGVLGGGGGQQTIVA